MEVETETEESASASASSPPGNLVAALEQATLMAKLLPTTTDPSQLLQILATFNSAHHHLSLILSNHHDLPPSPPPSQVPRPTIFPSQAPENSAVEENDDDPMVMGEEEQNSRAVEKVASRMRECFIQNKRPKRMLSPSPELHRRYDDEAEVEVGFHYYKSSSLDLIYQFHA